MKFGPVSPREALGGVLAHSVRAGEVVFRKGRLVGEAEVAILEAAGISEIVVAILDEGDIAENEAAAYLAKEVAGDGVMPQAPFTGRANLHAASAGVLVLDPPAIDAANWIDEGITLATLPNHSAVAAGDVVATVKIIPYAVARAALHAAADAARAAIRIAPYRLQRVALLSTRTPGLKASVIDKTIRVTQARLEPMGARVVCDIQLAHHADKLAAELASLPQDVELIIIFGASAVADRRDVVPAAIEAAGGRVVHLGMPVDPGNLLLLGDMNGCPVIGAPGCARSPKDNGFDWVLRRLVAGLPVTRADITGWGVGGFLSEIGTRPQPRRPET